MHVHFFPQLLTDTFPYPGRIPAKIHLNATQESDWESVVQVTHRASCVAGFPQVVPSFGIHPWYVTGLSEGWEERLTEKLNQFPDAGVGEIGLDALRPDLELQKEVFLTQLELARSLKRSVSVHCVRAWESVESLIQKTVGPEGLTILLHGYNGSVKQAVHFFEELHWNVFFSLTASRTQLESPKTQELFQNLPFDRIVMESDAENTGQTRGFLEFCQQVEVLKQNVSKTTTDH
ncbi:MAG: TatD family hydrolase [Thermoguttaceae bacterium]|nr:TatD family hydrolase [Thermoguttaceae bacterium]